MQQEKQVGTILRVQYIKYFYQNRRKTPVFGHGDMRRYNSKRWNGKSLVDIEIKDSLVCTLVPAQCGESTSVDMRALALGDKGETIVESPVTEGSRNLVEQAEQSAQAISTCL
ncbi:MAG: hypothetical protein LBD79_06185 [Treponema sp.]|jgi:hypothetical protein|nr:hypothetical protein [Treponema sp.]